MQPKEFFGWLCKSQQDATFCLFLIRNLFFLRDKNLSHSQSLIKNTYFRCPKPQLPNLETSTSVAPNLNFCHRVPYAARSDSVRHPIRFRPPPDRIPSATRHTSYAFTSISHNIYTFIPKPSQNTTITSIPLF